jgi:TRAP transporter TAXI family solute receptor
MRRKGYLIVLGAAFLVLILGIWLMFRYVAPWPPNRLVMGAGRPGGAYYLFAQQYREILARDRVTLEVRETAGSVENLERLRATHDGVDIAFVQGGTGNPKEDSGLRSLGSLFYEPLWVFYRSENSFTRPGDLRGKRLAVGERGSGTKSITLRLLEAMGLMGPPTVLEEIGGQEAADALVNGRVDVAFFISSPRAPLIQRLVRVPNVRLASFERAEAFTRIYPYLTRISLPQGVVDLARNLPPRDTVLLAVTANLVVRDDFHRALADLLLQAAQEIHESAGLLEREGEFPAPKYLEFPLSDAARGFYKRGPSFLRRYLPFWIAAFMDRMLVLLIPLLALAWPMLRILPPVYRWRMRRRIFRWYKYVRAIDLGLWGQPPVEELKRYAAEIDRIERDLSRVEIPMGYVDQLYNLRVHLHLVRRRLEEARTGSVRD